MKIISLQTTYGYEIIEKLTAFGFDDVKEGTIYPLLVRLEGKELITSRLQPSPMGPKRKYYSVSQKGEQWLQLFEQSWVELNSVVTAILGLKEES